MDRANLSADPQRLASALSYLQQQGSPMMQEGMPQGQHMMPDGQPMPDQMMPPPQAADMGRSGDTTVGHLTPGEVVVPVDLQTPQLMAALMEALGPDFGRYQVGGDDDSINPQTGMPEFGYDDGGYGSENEGTGGFGGYSGDGGGDRASGANTGGFGSAGGNYGPSEGASWGPSNPDAQGTSQYGSSVFGSMFGEEGDSTRFSGYRTLPDWQRDLSTPERRGVFNSFESAKGGGFMGSLGRFGEGLFGVSRKAAYDPDEQAWGVQRDWNPGVLAGLAFPGIGGVIASQLAQRAYDATGLPKPSGFSAADVRSPTER